VTVTFVQVDLEKFRALCSERDRLAAQVDELQTRMTEMVESSLARQVRAFHARFGHPTVTTPSIPGVERVRFRMRLIGEEFCELLQALGVDPRDVGVIRARTFEAVGRAELGGLDFPEAVDALADLDYVIEGTRAEFGVHGAPIAAEVHRANMSKGPNGPNGKPVKPPTWRGPDIVGELRKQGWR
jgi:predicted HAD superfamily Cof-like phosphohydrolase